VEALRADYELHGKLSAQNASYLERVQADFGDRRAVDLTAEHVDRYIEQRLEVEAAKASINRVTQMLRRACTLAIRRGHLSRAPYIRRLSEKSNERTGFFPEQEVRAVISHLPADLKDFVLFAYLCGWRKGSIASLRWIDVDLDTGELNLPGQFTKNGESLKMVIEGELVEIIKRRKEERAVKTESGTKISSLVFHRDGKRVQEFRKSWSTACKLAKCPGRPFHDLRRTCARDLIRSGVNETVAMRITGHKTRSIFDRYNITDTDDLREAMVSVEKYRKTRKQKVVAMG
jgi:integrase